MWPSGISGPMSGAAILSFLREASSIGPVLFSAFVSPSQGSWSPTESGFINTRTILNSTRRSAPRFRLKWRLSHNVFRRWRSGSSTTGFNWTQPSPRPWSLAQGGVFPSWSPSPRWISAMVMWRSGAKSKSLSMNAQVKSLMKTSNFHIRALRHVCRGLTFESAEMIALVLVTSRLDYCNSLLYETSKANIGRLQRVQNDLARVVLQAAWNTSSKPLLKHLHWLPVQQRIILKIALVTFNVRTFEQPSYLHSLLDNTYLHVIWGQKKFSLNSFPEISCCQTQFRLRCANRLEQPQLINTGSNQYLNIQDRIVSLGLSVNIHRPPPLHPT